VKAPSFQAPSTREISNIKLQERHNARPTSNKTIASFLMFEAYFFSRAWMLALGTFLPLS
jgi:hypothetical protein